MVYVLCQCNYSAHYSGLLEQSVRSVNKLTAVCSLYSAMAGSDASILDFLLIVGNLKREKRTGWRLRSIPEPESISDHMYRMALCSMLIQDPALDKNRCIKMSLVHDMCEALVGDITPHCGISVEEKHQREKEAMETMCSKLSPNIATEIMQLYVDYEEQRTAEAHTVKDLDRFEMVLQAYEYEDHHRRPEDPKYLQQFFQSVQGKIRNVEIQNWMKELEQRRSQLHESSETGTTNEGS